MNINYFINSNTGDIIIEKDGKYSLLLIARYESGKPLNQEIIELTKSQFLTIKGFVPIKRKKLKSAINLNKYAPTLPDGTKGESKRVEIPSKGESRESILNKIGI
jgi:hypothetical protein